MNTDNLKKEIRKVKVWHVAVLCAGIFLAFAIIGTIMIAAGGGWIAGQGIHIGWQDVPRFGPGKTYDVNDHGAMDLEGVDSIVIKTISDDAILQGGGDKITADLVGQCRSTGDPVSLDAHKDGSTYYIEVKYPTAVNINSSTNLTVTIPEAYAGSLSVVTVSGDIKADGLPLKLNSVSLHSTSGGIMFGTASYGGMKAGTVSGDITLAGILADTAVSSTSGQVNLDYSDIAPTTVSTVSGDVKAILPQAAQFGVDFGTTSGTFSSTQQNLSVTSADHGFKGGTSGKPCIKVNTVSGDFKIEGK